MGIQDIIGNIAAFALNQISRPRLPKIAGDITLKGLNHPVEIFRDRYGVPHIYASDMHDLFFGQGFVHAQDRLWQMEFNRRLVAGRLAEIIGEAVVPIDRWMRTLTMRRVAEFEADLLGQKVRNLLTAYAEGVNSYINTQPLPIEFKLLGHEPEPWVIADTLAWPKMMAWTLSVNWESEILRAQLIAKLGAETAAELEPPHLGRWPYVVPPGSDYSYIGSNALERAKEARPFVGPSPYDGLGSNNWVLAGSRTETGKPILANDMHLGMTIPSIWYENHLIGEDLNVIGVMFPGMPGIISGHNGHVAWGLTNGFPDVQDIYLERLRRTTEGIVQAEYNGTWENTRVLKEVISVKGQDPVTEEVVITRHGPIINSLAPDFTGEQPLALRWVALEPNTMYEVILDMLTAKNCEQFHQALRSWVVPVQNIVYADTSGNIAYTYAGKIPVRAKGDGRVPVPGWTDEYEWIGYIPFDGLPHLFNPPQGFVATANNTTISEDYPFPIFIEAITGDRCQRIVELIQDGSSPDTGKKIDINFIQQMQFNQISPTARLFSEHLARLTPDPSDTQQQTQEVIDLFKNWDGELSPSSAAAAVYQVLIRKMINQMLQNRLRDNENENMAEKDIKAISLLDRLLGKGPVPALADTSLAGDRWLSWLSLLLEHPDSHWFDLGNGEKRDDVLLNSLNLAVDELNHLSGNNVANWQWGTLHTLYYNHIMSSVPVLKKFFNRGPYPIGGDHTTIWATATNYHNLDCPQVVGPPYRMIVDLADIGNSCSILSPGQSGHAASKNYDDQAQAWFNKGYHPMLFNREDVIAQSKNRLELRPPPVGK